jgi:hypothetical protein
MGKTRILFLFLIIFYLGCRAGKDPVKQTSKNLLGAWRFVDIEAPLEMDKAQKDQILNKMEELLQESTLEFKNDNVFVITIGTESATGKWSISENGKTITTVEKNQTKTQFDIDRLRKNKLVLLTKTDYDIVKITLSK